MPYGYDNNGGYSGGPMIDFGNTPNNSQQNRRSTPGNSYHIFVLIFGILSAVIFFQSPLIAFIPSIAGLIMSIILFKRQFTSTKMVIGFVLCLLVVIFSIAYTVLIIWTATAPIDEVHAFYQSFGFDIDRYKIK